VACVTIAVIVVAMILSSTRPAPYAETSDRTVVPAPICQQQQHVPALADFTEFGYVLRDYNGLLTVFTRENPDTPFYRTDVRVRTLRQHDQDLLTAGIAVSDHMHLQQLLDDFTT